MFKKIFLVSLILLISSVDSYAYRKTYIGVNMGNVYNNNKMNSRSYQEIKPSFGVQYGYFWREDVRTTMEFTHIAKENRDIKRDVRYKAIASVDGFFTTKYSVKPFLGFGLGISNEKMEYEDEVSEKITLTGGPRVGVNLDFDSCSLDLVARYTMDTRKFHTGYGKIYSNGSFDEVIYLNYKF